MRSRVILTITGEVQGVFFRHQTKMEAEKLGLTGWVRNEDDGSVKIVAEGTEENLQKLIEWCKKGTEFSKVEKGEVEWSGAREEFVNFEIK